MKYLSVSNIGKLICIISIFLLLTGIEGMSLKVVGIVLTILIVSAILTTIKSDDKFNPYLLR